MTYILVDTLNMFYRARHVVRGDDIETKIGMAYSIMFGAINKAWRDFDGSHVVFCFEGRSWRKDFYKPYKANRTEKREALSPKDKEEDQQYFAAFDELRTFIEKRTNCTTLQHMNCEADDFIGRWIQNHPNDNHVIISSDSDFYQLLSPTVSQYNGITNEHHTVNGTFNDKGKPVIDKKTKIQKHVGDPSWVLFEKCVRGDSIDNVFSAYPGVRKKGSKNKVGLLEAYADKDSKGFDWNNFMLQRWTDHEGVEHRVLDDYNRNKTLIDLTLQPDDIKTALDESITTQVQKEPTSSVGVHFLRFCGKHDLARISTNAETHSQYLNATYGNRN